MLTSKNFISRQCKLINNLLGMSLVESSPTPGNQFNSVILLTSEIILTFFAKFVKNKKHILVNAENPIAGICFPV